MIRNDRIFVKFDENKSVKNLATKKIFLTGFDLQKKMQQMELGKRLGLKGVVLMLILPK